MRGVLKGELARGAVLSLWIRLGAIGIGMAQAVLTARLLGPEGYGAVAYVLSLAMILATLALCGTETLAVREVARFLAHRNAAGLQGFQRNIRQLVLWAALVGATLLGMAALTSSREGTQPLTLFAVLLFPIFAFTLQGQGILRGHGRVAMAQIPFQLLRPLLLVTVLLTAWGAGLAFGPSDYLTAVLVIAALAMAVVMIAIGRQTPAVEAQPVPTPLWQITRQALPFYAGSVLGLLLGEINTLLLAWLAGPEETGLYQPIARIAPLLVLGAHAASVRYAPLVSELWALGEFERLASVTRKFTLATTIFSLVAATILFLLGERILGLFGAEYAVHTNALWWVVCAQVFNAACGPIWSLLTMTGHSVKVLAPQAAGLVVHMGIGLLLIPNYGVTGAAIAMAMGIVVWNIAMLLAAKRNLPIDPTLLSWFSHSKT